MKFLSCHLEPPRARLLYDELEQAMGLLRERGRPIPDWEIRVLAISTDELPAEIAAEVSLDAVAEAPIPTTMAERLAWERRLQSFQIVSRAPRAWIVGGGQIGAIYGFYEFLKRATGIRWYGLSDDDTCLAPVADTVAIERAPEIVLRGFEETLNHPEAPAYFRKYLRWMVRNRWNLMLLNAAKWKAYPHRDSFIAQAQALGIRLAIGAHAPELFLPEAAFDEHPEWFCYRDGERRLRGRIELPEAPELVIESALQPCYTNPEVRACIADSIAAYVRDFPETEIFSLWPHDGINNWCRCPSCLETTPYEAMHALALEVQEKLPPHVPVEVLCYSNLLNIPRRPLAPTPRSYSLFCPYLRHYRHRFYDPGFSEEELVLGTRYPEPDRINPIDDREYGVLLDRWRPVLESCGSALGIFAYYQLAFHDETRSSDACRYLYVPEPQLVADEIDRFKANGAKVFYDCSHPSPGFWPNARLYAYLPDLFWNQREPVERLVHTYYRATLGDELGPIVQAVLQRLSAALADRSQPLPEELLEELDATIARIPGDTGRRYGLWLHYLRLGERSWQAARRGEVDKVIEAEQEIIALLDEQRDFLADYLNARWLSRYSTSVIRFFSTGRGAGALPEAAPPEG